jgi:hypothetical protein
VADDGGLTLNQNNEFSLTNSTIVLNTHSVALGGSLDLTAADVGAAASDGSNASGTWGISITGSSASCTGNATTATTATNLSTPPTLTKTGTPTINLTAATAYTLTVGGETLVF